MKLRLLGGFESYTGQMGVINFTDGLSDGDVLPIDAVRVAGVIGAEWEDGSPANVGQMYVDNMNTPAPTPEEQLVAETANAAPQVVTIVEKYTEEQLAAIADAEGIAGLRKIADPIGVKGNSISGLIASILKAGAPAPVQEDDAAPAQENAAPEVTAEVAQDETVVADAAPVTTEEVK